MSSLQMQTFTFKVKQNNIDQEEATTILESVGFYCYDYPRYLDFDGTLAVVLSQDDDSRLDNLTSCITYWYKGQSLCYGINKKHRLAPESFLSITIRNAELGQESAIAIARRLIGTPLEVEEKLITSPIADFDRELHQVILQEISF